MVDATNADLKRAFKLLVGKLQFDGWSPALMGKPTAPSTWDFTPVGPSGWKYVRIISGAGMTVTRVINTAAIPDTGDLEIWIGPNSDSQLETKSLRRQGF